MRDITKRQPLKTGVRAAGLIAATLACTSLHAQPNCSAGVAQSSAALKRFDDNADGTVTDRRSQLMWLRCSARQDWTGGACSGEAGTLSWPEAQAYAAEVNGRGTFFFNDWRVPKLSELASIAELHCADPRIHPGVFPGTPARYFWTASTRPAEGSQDRAYALSFGTEGAALMNRKDQNHVRLVRNAR